jgi:hypothetical protein
VTTPSPPVPEPPPAPGPPATPATPRMPARPALDPGDLLASRYRLTEVVSAETGPALLWRATDEVLARPVAVKVLPANGRAGHAAATPFLDAAGRASALAHPGLVRVYDAAREERPALRSNRMVDVAYVISEWVDGRSAAEVLQADGPYEPAEAVRMVQQAAEALAAAHARGVGHGRVHLGNLLVSPGGRVRLTDAAVAAAAHRRPLPAELTEQVQAADTRDLGAVLYALLTARWPAASTDQPSCGLADAPRAAAGVYAPRQVRAGVPRNLDSLVVRVLDPGRQPGLPPITTPLALATALDEVDVRTPETARVAPTRRTRSTPSWVRRALPKLAAVAFLTAVGVTCYQLGQNVGELPRRPGALDALVASTPSPEGGVTSGTRVDLRKAPVAVRDYDPGSRDGQEQSSSVPNAYDGDLSTLWSTDGYNSATFGNLKPGVGLLVDLGSPVALSAVQVGMSSGGADVELRAANAPGEGADDFTVVTRVRGAKQVASLKPNAPTPSRYWLVWFTKLPKADDGKYRLGVAELVFTRAG